MSDPRRNLAQEEASSLAPLRANAARADAARAIGRFVVVALHARRCLVSLLASSAKRPTMMSNVAAHGAHRNPGLKCAKSRANPPTGPGRFILAFTAVDAGRLQQAAQREAGASLDEDPGPARSEPSHPVPPAGIGARHPVHHALARRRRSPSPLSSGGLRPPLWLRRRSV